MTAHSDKFLVDAAAKSGDLRHRGVIQKATTTYFNSVAAGKSRFLNWENARSQVAAIKWETINHLDTYLELFERKVTENGGRVHWAETAEDARRIVLQLAAQHGVKKVVKSKSMTTEEIHLNDAFAAAGIHTVETDLGEYICQIRNEPPYHIVTPVMHLTKADIAADFHNILGAPLTDNAEELTMIAREKLRQEFLLADMGVTGANFAIAESGAIAITENEGNARLGFSLPRIHVAIVGIEKLIPRMDDLALLWPVLSTAGTGQAITSYSSMIAGPRQDNDTDGPSEFHVVLLDNGRTRLLADVEQRDALHCIRCGACLNVCPIFRNVGGHAYGTTYQGPIGSVITPHLRDSKEWSHLPSASSLCGACTDVCPVRIELHHHLLQNRRNAIRKKYDPVAQRLVFKLWLWTMQSPLRYRIAGKLAWLGFKLGLARIALKPWTATRDFPSPPQESFKDWWESQS